MTLAKTLSGGGMQTEALEVYQKVCAATAEGNQSALRQVSF